MKPIHTNDQSYAIQFRSISFQRADQVIVKDISLTIPAGQWVALAGRNGSGKSTITRLISGLLQPEHGEILIHGAPLKPPHIYEQRLAIGYIFPSPDDQFFGLTVRDDIAFGLENLCLPREEMEIRIQQYAELLSITPLLDRHPATLSGGQKQRAALAAVLAMKPSILILDEATSMLDHSFRKQFMELLTHLKEEQGITIIMISHDFKELAVADRLIMLDEGFIIADGEPQLLLKQQELLDACRLTAPYALELTRELRLLNVEIEECLDDEEVLTQLWALLSSKSLTATKTGH